MEDKRVLSVDIETYSEVDIVSCGSFRYIDDPSFEVLLFGYSWNGKPAAVVDLICGEMIPDEVVDALYDPAVIKTGFNNEFERYALWKHFGAYLPPEQWEDTMVLAAQCGLPLSLAGVCDALQMGEDEGKMKEGKALINYFCKPCKATKANGMRTRNVPEHDPDRWTRFKLYNARDVNSEYRIRETLLRYIPSEIEHRFWCLDARINEKGIPFDPVLAKAAIEIDEQNKARLIEEAAELTGMENPNSVAQIKAWLKEQEGIDVPTLNKKAISDVVSQLTQENTKRFMQLRKEISKSSVKKYDAMIRSAGPDDHIRGCFRFYGANRTGRFCLTGDHEVLTRNGWCRLDQWAGGQIAVWDIHMHRISFQKSEALQFPYEGEMFVVRHQRCGQISTPDHKMPIRTKSGAWEPHSMSEFFGKRFTMAFTGTRVRERPGNADEVRVLIMVQADGHYTQEGDLRLAFKKMRKAERCKRLLRRAGLPFIYRFYESDGRHSFSIPRSAQPLWLRQFREKVFDWWMLDEDPDVILDELEHWDCYRCGPNSLQYTSTIKQNAEVIQAICILSGRSATLLHKERTDDNPNWSDAYILNIWLTPGESTDIRREQQSTIDFSGTVYCANTPTGYFMVRREGKVWVTGNSGRNVQLQNLPQTHLPDLAMARSLVRAGDAETVELLYESTSATLSELIRTALVPEPGHRFIVSDFSAIEDRVIAWIANEKWRLDVFENGGDIYCASASQMFKVPVEKHGQNAHLRQKGKISELALGYGGGVNALLAFGADKMGMTDEEMAETVAMWRDASPQIVRLWKSLENAAVKAITRNTSSVSSLGGIRFDYENGILWMNLPSGRRIAYWDAQYAPSKQKRGQRALSYMGVDQKTKKWTRVETWGGKLAENLTQATARDCLRDKMLALDAAGFDIRMHVHDEIVVTEPLDGKTLEQMNAIMNEPLPWAPGLPLRGDGYYCDFYQKD